MPHGWLGFTTVQVGSGGLAPGTLSRALPSVVLHALQYSGKSTSNWRNKMRRQASNKIKKGPSLERSSGCAVGSEELSSLEYTKLGWEPPGRVP